VILDTIRRTDTTINPTQSIAFLYVYLVQNI